MEQLNLYYLGGGGTPSVPDGKTVEPVGVVQTWIKCAGRSEAYTTLADVIADATCLAALMADSNASDYLVRSTTFAPTLCASSDAMTQIGLSNYCANTLIADSTWLNYICHSSYIDSVLNVKVPTGGTAIMTAGSWGYTPQNNNINNIFDGDTSTSTYTCSAGWPWGMGYRFSEPVKIIAFRYLYDTSTVVSGKTNTYQSGHKFKIRSSDDGNNWTNIESFEGDTCTWWNTAIPISNNTAHDYYDIYLENNNLRYDGTAFPFIRINELQFYGRKDI